MSDDVLECDGPIPWEGPRDAVEVASEAFEDGPDDECCSRCGKRRDEFGEMGCGVCDRRSPEFGLV